MNQSSQRSNWPGLTRSQLAAFDVIIEAYRGFPLKGPLREPTAIGARGALSSSLALCAFDH